MIKLFDHSDKLLRLLNLGGSQQEVNNEFDRMCDSLLGGSPADLSNDTIDSLNAEMSGMAFWLGDRMVTYCKAQGFDPIISGNHPVPFLREFVMMLLAREKGLLPATTEERAARRLALEAETFVADKDVIKGH